VRDQVLPTYETIEKITLPCIFNRKIIHCGQKVHHETHVNMRFVYKWRDGEPEGPLGITRLGKEDNIRMNL